MDNCSVHHTDKVVGLLQSAGIVIMYLPPYSPDLMPLEESLKITYKGLLQVVTDPRYMIIAAFDSKSCHGWIQHVGYMDIIAK